MPPAALCKVGCSDYHRKTDSLFTLLVDMGNNFMKRSSLKFRAFSLKLRVHGVARYDVRNSTVPDFAFA